MATSAESRRQVGLAAVFSALPDFAIAATFLITWVRPLAFGESMVAYLMLVMLLEFIVVHSAGFMGSAAMRSGERRKQVIVVLGLGAFYTLFVAGFALAFSTWWPLVAFWALTLNRLTPLLLGQAPDGQEKAMVMRGWAAGAVFYLLFVGVTTLLPLPRFGITAPVVSAQELPGEGLWIDEPHRVIAFGFLYFSAWGISELYAHGWAAAGQGAA